MGVLDEKRRIVAEMEAERGNWLFDNEELALLIGLTTAELTTLRKTLKDTFDRGKVEGRKERRP